MRGKEESGVSEICLASRAQGSRHASCRAQGGQCDTSRGKASTRIQAPGQAAKKSLEMRPQGANLWYGQRDQSIRETRVQSARAVSLVDRPAKASTGERNVGRMKMTGGHFCRCSAASTGRSPIARPCRHITCHHPREESIRSREGWASFVCS